MTLRDIPMQNLAGLVVVRGYRMTYLGQDHAIRAAWEATVQIVTLLIDDADTWPDKKVSNELDDLLATHGECSSYWRVQPYNHWMRDTLALVREWLEERGV